MRQAPNKISFLVDHDRHVTSHRNHYLLREKRCHQIKEFAMLPFYRSGPELEPAKGHELPPHHLIAAWPVDNHPTHWQADFIGLFLPDSVTTSGGSFHGCDVSKDHNNSFPCPHGSSLKNDLSYLWAQISVEPNHLLEETTYTTQRSKVSPSLMN